MFAAPSSRHHQITLRGMVEIIVVIVSPRLERPNIDHGFAARRHDLFKMQVAAFEFGHDVVEVLDVKDDLFSRGCVRLGRVELVVLDGQ